MKPMIPKDKKKMLYYDGRLYISRFVIGSQLNCSNMLEDDVIMSAIKIIRAARFCSLESLSILVPDVEPNVLLP